jgi:hypothetical protein
MFSDVTSLWSSANSAIQNIGENISSALENLEEDLEDQENAQLSESEIYKKLLDDAQMQHFQLSKQFRVLVSEKESEALIWKQKYIALGGKEEVVAEDKSKSLLPSVDGNAEQSDDLNAMTAEEKEHLLVKTLAEVRVLQSCMQEVEGQLKRSLHEKNEATACQKKNSNLEREIKDLRSRNKEESVLSSTDIQKKSEEIDDLVSEYSKLASESEKQKSSDTQRIREVELENEMLTMRMQALEHSLTELADRSSDRPPSSSSSSESPDSSSSSTELKELKARVVHLEYDIKSKDATLLDLQARQQQQQGSLAPSSSSSDSGSGGELQALQAALAKRAEEVTDLQQVGS